MIREKLIQEFELPVDYISITTIHKALQFLKITHKKVIPFHYNRNSARTKAERKLVARKLLYCIDNEYEVVYIDEVGFNRQMAPLYGYAPSGERCFVVSPAKSKNYSVVVAMTAEGYLGFQIFNGSVKSQDFAGFLSSLVSSLALSNPNDKYVFLMDNAAIHRSKIFKEIVGNQVSILYNAPYSPMFNCIEELFSKWKGMVRKAKPKDEATLLKVIVETSKRITLKDHIGYHKHALKMMKEAFLEKDIH